MHIEHVTLYSQHPDKQAYFFRENMGLPVAADKTGVTITIGTSKLTFAPIEQATLYHYAIEIPENQFQAAVTWLSERAEILAGYRDKRVFYNADWNADMVYFLDADGNIAELIARHNQPTGNDEAFSSSSLLYLSEISLVSPHVIQTVQNIKKQTGLKAWRGAGSETFTAVGDENGLFIVAQAGRPWKPSDKINAYPSPLHIRISGAQGDMSFDDLPYQIEVVEAINV